MQVRFAGTASHIRCGLPDLRLQSWAIVLLRVGHVSKANGSDGGAWLVWEKKDGYCLDLELKTKIRTSVGGISAKDAAKPSNQTFLLLHHPLCDKYRNQLPFNNLPPASHILLHTTHLYSDVAQLIQLDQYSDETKS